MRYPILPRIERASEFSRNEILHIRHHSLFAPRDFDLSPYFSIVKPTIERGFDYKAMVWSDNPLQDAIEMALTPPGPSPRSSAEAPVSR